MIIRKEDLKTIWNWLKTQITDEDLAWLRRRRPLWQKVSKDRSDFWQWEARHALRVYDLSFKIRDILDAKRKRTEMRDCFGEGLPKQYVLELAELLGLEVSEKRPKYEVLGKIIKKIEQIEKS